MALTRSLVTPTNYSHAIKVHHSYLTVRFRLSRLQHAPYSHILPIFTRTATLVNASYELEVDDDLDVLAFHICVEEFQIPMSPLEG